MQITVEKFGNQWWIKIIKKLIWTVFEDRSFWNSKIFLSTTPTQTQVKFCTPTLKARRDSSRPTCSGLLKNGGLMSEILPENNHSSFLKGLLLQTDKKQPSKQALDPPAQNNNVTSWFMLQLLSTSLEFIRFWRSEQILTLNYPTSDSLASDTY